MSGLVLVVGGTVCGGAMGSAFSYQGRLTDGGDPAEGAYDFEFRLFDSMEGGSQVGVTRRIDGLEVVGGYFTTELDFGNAPFAGESRWLDVGVRSGALEDPNDFTVLSPRQAVTAAPYALYAANSPDSDTLAGLSCDNGQIPKWNGTAWVCGEDLVGGGPGPGPTSTSGTWKAVRVIGEQRLFRDIVLLVADGDSVDGSLVYLDGDGQEARRINFYGIVPVSFDTLEIDLYGGGSLLEETLEFSVSRVELGINVAGPRTMTGLFSDNFRFELGGSIADVVAVMPGPIFFDYPDPQPIDFIPETPSYSGFTDGGDGVPTSYSFNFEIAAGASDPDPEWLNISGGAMQFLIPDVPRPRMEITFSDVELFGLMVYSDEREDMVEWLNKWLSGHGAPGDSELEILDVDGETKERVLYRDVVPVSYYPAGVHTRTHWLLYEYLTFKAHIIEAN